MHRFVVALLVASGLGLGCTSSGPPPLRVGVDRGLEALGLAQFLVAGFEEETKTRVQLRFGGVDDLLEWANNGELDVTLMVSEDALQALAAEGLPIRTETYAHEELLLIGPFQDYLGRYAKDSGFRLLQAVSRINYRYLKAAPGSVERARHDKLFRESNDRAEPGSFFESKLEGVPFVRQVIDDQAFALVKRSSLLMSILEGKRPHRIYKERDPALVLRLVLAEIHPGKTKRPRRPAFFDYVMGEAGQTAIAAFGKDRFGYPLFGSGAPAPGEGAGVPGLEGAAAPAPE